MATILDGRTARSELSKGLAIKIAAFRKERGFPPTLAIIQVGDRPDTAAYIKAKKSFGKEIGAEVRHIHMPEAALQADIVSEIERQNADEAVSGIIVQLPLPADIDKREVIDSIDPAKDADGLTSESMKDWGVDEPGAIWPATARGVRELLSFYGVALAGKRVCVIGRSELVGTPVAAMCRDEGAKVTICHSKTADLKKETLSADVIISAVGKKGLISSDHVREGQTVIDIGGDADLGAVTRTIGGSGAVTPVPGGVGPMTVLALFENLVDLCYSERR